MRRACCVIAWLLGAPLLVLAGPRSANASGPTLDAIASERGIAAGELCRAEVTTVVSGMHARKGERRALSLHGIPVRGGFETRWIAADGHERIVAARYPAADAQLLPDEARVGVTQARTRVEALVPTPQRARVRDGQLVYLLLAEQPVLAWEFITPLSLGPRAPSRLRAWVSARTGVLLEVEELVLHAKQAQVYAINPVHTPEPSLVTLGNLEDDPQPWAEGVELEPGYLNGARTRVFNCIDAPDGVYAPWHKDDECYATQRVHADLEGDYFVPLPDVAQLADNMDPQDLYAELALYWHAEQFFTRLAELGVDGFPCERTNMLANFHRLIADDPTEFQAYSNAYYSGVCDIEEGPTMLVGQGSQVDFAYDGDVVYHELGHGIVEQLTTEGLLGYRYRSDGTLRDARGINEAIADYHAIILTGRPELGEYIALYTPTSTTEWFRNADNLARCPDDLNGEEHTDGVPLTGALWSARTRIGGDKLDGVVLGSLALLARDATLEEAAAALLEVGAAEVEAGNWTALDRELLERSLAGRNLLDCERVIDSPPGFDQPRKLLLRAKSEAVEPFWPGPLQYRHIVPAGSDNLIVSFEVSSFGGSWASAQLEPLLLVKRSGVSDEAAITYEFELGEQDEVWSVTGDWDDMHTSTHLNDLRRQVLLRDLAPGEVVHVAFATLDPEATVLRELTFASVPSEDLEHGSPQPGDEEQAESEFEDDGCHCAGAPRPIDRSLSLLVLLAAWRLRSRRARHR
jgi:hypothetical protein